MDRDVDRDVDREELLDQLETVRPEMQRTMRSLGMHEPDWKPLEKVLPLKWCAGFMFFGYSGDIRTYKQGFTRYCLHIDSRGNTYAYNSRTDSYIRIPRSLAIAHVFSGIERMGFTRETPFDEKNQAKRIKMLEDAGWTVVSVTPDGN